MHVMKLLCQLLSEVPKFFLLFPYAEVKEFIVLGNCLDCVKKGHLTSPETVLTMLRQSTAKGLEWERAVR